MASDTLEARSALKSLVETYGQVEADESEGNLTVGDGVGAAQINFATTGQDRALYGNNGTVGFLKSDNSGWNASSDPDGDWNVD